MRKIGVVCIILASSLLLTGCRNPLTGKVVTLPFFEKEPAEVLQLMQQQMASEQTFRAVTESSLVASGGTAPLTSTELSQRVMVDVDRVGNQAMIENRVTLGLAGASYQVTSESFYGDGKLYFRFTQLPLLPFLNLQGVSNQWFVRDLAAETTELKDDLRIDEEALVRAAPQVEALVRQTTIFTVKERLLDEPVDGVNSYHYLVQFDEAGLTAFADAVYRALQPGVPALKDKPFDAAELRSVLESLRGARIEVWIGKDDVRLRKLAIAGSYARGNEQLQYAVVTTFTHFGDRFIATAPPSAKPADEFAKQLDLSKIREQLESLLPLLGGSFPPEQLKQIESLFPSS